MATFGELQTAIANRLSDSSLTSQIADAINATIDYYGNDQFWFNTASATITLNIGDPVIPNIPSDFLFEQDDGGLYLNYSTRSWPITKISQNTYNQMNCQATGIPRFYRSNGTSLELYYYPDQAYSLILTYIKSYPLLVNAADFNDWTVQAARLLIAKTLADIYIDNRKSKEMASYYNQKALDEYNSLMSRNNQKITTGNLVIDSIVDNIGDFPYLIY